MIDGPTSAVICAALIGLIAAIIKFVPPKQSRASSDSEDRCHRRMAGIETRVAVVEANYENFGRSFDELRREIHEMRSEVRELAGRRRPPG